MFVFNRSLFYYFPKIRAIFFTDLYKFDQLSTTKLKSNVYTSTTYHFFFWRKIVAQEAR